MLLNFGEHHPLSIWSKSMLIKFQLLNLTLVVTSVEFSPVTAFSAAAKSSSSTFVSSNSWHFRFLSFLQLILIYIRWAYIILVLCFSLLLLVGHFFLLLWLYSLSSCSFRLSSLFMFNFIVFLRVCLYCLLDFVWSVVTFFGVEPEIKRF